MRAQTLPPKIPLEVSSGKLIVALCTRCSASGASTVLHRVGVDAQLLAIEHVAFRPARTVSQEPAMPASSVRRRRVLIVAFLLPNSIEFHTDESSVHGSSEKWTAPPSPELKSQLTDQQLADMLSVRLQLAKSQQDKVRLDPTRALSSPSTSRRPSINSATRERINMAELMAEASGSGSAYLQPHASSAIATSGPPSPKVSEIPDELVSAPARVPVSSVKSSMSDHGRHAGDEGDNAAVSLSLIHI